MSSSQTEKALQVCESLIAEHRLMEGFLLSLENRLNALPLDNAPTPADRQNIQALLDTIHQDMNVHFACEERALFPAVSPYHPMVLMEVEHEELIALRDTLTAQFTEGDLAAFQHTSRQFIEYLRDHIAREDAGIFPTCEQSLSPAEKQQTIEAMNRIRAQAQQEAIPAIIRPEKSFMTVLMNLDKPLERPLNITLLAEKPGLQIKHLTLRAGESLPAYWSPKRLFIWCVSGEAVFTADPNPPVDLKAGVGVLLDPQLTHGITAQQDCHLLLILQALDSQKP